MGYITFEKSPFLHRPDVNELLKSKLPSYIVQSFLKSGYDEIDDIAEMDVSDESPKNSIKRMEEYINKKRKKFPECMGPDQSDDEPFEFSPGHIEKIKRFINEVKQLHKPQKRKVQLKAPQKKSKKLKIDISPSISSESEQSISSENYTPAGINATTDEIRSKVLKWGRKQDLNLVENQHFTIIVKNDVFDSTKLCASVRCSCGKNYIINQKSNSWLISNWTRHFQTCKQEKKDQGRQGSLVSYLTPKDQQGSNNAAGMHMMKPHASNFTALPQNMPYYYQPPMNFPISQNFQQLADVHVPIPQPTPFTELCPEQYQPVFSSTKQQSQIIKPSQLSSHLQDAPSPIQLPDHSNSSSVPSPTHSCISQVFQ